MKTFDPFSTTNQLYGKYYKRITPYIPPGPSYTKPTMEDDFRKTTLEMRKNYFDPFSHLKNGTNNIPPTKETQEALMNQTMSFFNRMNSQIQTRRLLQEKYTKPIPTQYYIGHKVKPMSPYRPKTPPYLKDTFPGIKEKRDNGPETTYQYSYQWKLPVRFGSEYLQNANSMYNMGTKGPNGFIGKDTGFNVNRPQSAMPSYSQMASLAQRGYSQGRIPTPRNISNNNFQGGNISQGNFNQSGFNQSNINQLPQISNQNGFNQTPQISNQNGFNQLPEISNQNGFNQTPQISNQNNYEIKNTNEESIEKKQEINIDKVSNSKVGLSNIDNDDYINSSIQILIHCPPFIYTFLSESQKKFQTSNPGEISKSFIELLLNFSNCPDGQFFPITNFKSIFKNYHPQFKNSKNDSQEFIRFFLQDINNELNRISNKNLNQISIPQSNKNIMYNQYKSDCYSKENSIITDLFIGFMSFEFLCSCGSKDFAFGQFLDLPLLFEDEITPQYDIYNLIKSNILRNEIIKVNEKCKDCQKICDRQQKIRIGNLPQLLILSFQRINFYNQTKNFAKIQFDENLDMKDFVDNEIFDNSSTKFRLWGILCHRGNYSNGHYYSYVKMNGSWFCFDDNVVNFGNPDFNSSDVYSLFFTRVNN